MPSTVTTDNKGNYNDCMPAIKGSQGCYSTVRNEVKVNK